LLIAAAGGACKSPPVSLDPGGGDGGAGRGAVSSQIEVAFEATSIRKLDLLLVIDNSSGMRPKQEAFAAALPALLGELRRGIGGLPDLRVAVVSSDVGAGPASVGSCRPLGDRGRFLVRAGCGLDPGVAHFVSAQESGARTNVSGRLEDALACLVRLGDGGCGFEHPLQAVRAALSRENPENQSFLRPDARLGIVILADEDDCSAPPDTDLFLSTPAGQAPGLVCAVEGHVCNGANVPAGELVAPLASCTAAGRGQTRLIPVDEIASYVRTLKAPARDRVTVAALVGWSSAADAVYAIGRDARNELAPAPLCTTALGPAAPALRLKAFVDAFAPRGWLGSLCAADVTATVAEIGRAINADTSPGCLPAGLADADAATPGVQPECVAADRRPGGSGASDAPIPACKAGAARPCFDVVADETCSGGLRVAVSRDGAGPPPAGTFVAVKCLAVAAAAAPASAPQGRGGPLGRPCEIPEAPPASRAALMKAPAPECASDACLRPSPEGVATVVDTAPLCTEPCARDADCERAELRDPRSPQTPADRRCKSRFVCAVPFEVGPWACRRLCACQDFFAAPPAVPASCRP
jgi:hypothetical protein